MKRKCYKLLDNIWTYRQIDDLYEIGDITQRERDQMHSEFNKRQNERILYIMFECQNRDKL